MKNVFVSVFFVMCVLQFGYAAGNVDKQARKEEVLEMFVHAYDSYMTNAYPADELMPLSCKGRVRGREPNRGDVDDSLGNFSLTLIDTLDTLAVVGMLDEFENAVRKVIADVRFDTDVVVSVFETNIRVVGGLLGGHTAAKDLQEHHGRMAWYNDELLGMAMEVGYRLLPAFNTTTGVPYPKVNLKHGLGNGRNEKDTCTACAGTMLLEFSALSRLSGDPIFEERAKSVMQTLWSKRQRTSNLVGTVINIHTGDWVRRESGVGAGIDSYYEYLLKGYILLGEDTYLDRFNTHYEAIQRYISDGPMLIDVQMHRPHARSRNFMDALLAFWPGLQVLFGDIEPAIETHEMLYQVTQRHNFLPEAFTPQYDVYWAQHPLRPEFIESTYMLYKATNDPYYLEVGGKIVDALQNHARVHCGFAGIKDVRTGSHEDRMDSFVLAETFKYLYLLFAEPEDLVLNIDDYLLTTEAHLLPLSISKIKSGSTLAANATADSDEDVMTGVIADRSCANHKYMFPSGSTYAQALRDPLKKAKHAQPAQCPSSTQQGAATVSDDSRLKAAEFVPGNPDHMQQLTQMGIRLITMKDGRVQLMHTASNAISPEAAEKGAAFMQEMIELSKSQQAEAVAENHPRVVQVMSPAMLKNVVLAAGPAQFGMDLNDNFAAVGEVVVADPFTACEDIKNGPDMFGKIIIMARGDCMFIDKARNLEKFGAHGGIVIDNVAETSSDTSAMFAMSGDGKDDVNIPMVFLFSKEGHILMSAIEEHGNVEVLLLDKAKTHSDLNEIQEHYHNNADAQGHIPLRVKAQVDSVRVTTADEILDIDQIEEHLHSDDTYDEDGDEEYECRAPRQRHPHTGEDGERSSPEQQKKSAAGGTKQLTDFIQGMAKFAISKSDIDKLLGQTQELLGGEELRESTQVKLDVILEEYETINGLVKQRLEQTGGADGFLTSATPVQLQSAFDSILKQYLETQEGQQHRADRAESALKHGMDSYDSFEVHPNSLAALGDIPKAVMENIVNEFIRMEKIRLELDKINPLHQQSESGDTFSETNQDSSRTKLPNTDSVEQGHTESDLSSSGDSGVHIPRQPQHGDSSTDSGVGNNGNQQIDKRQELLKQREQLLQQQMLLNQQNQRQRTEDGTTSTGQQQKQEL